jgi:hypothetical protein
VPDDAAADPPWRAVAGGVELRVRATPRGGRDGVEGLEALSDGRLVLKVRVRAAPEGGAATQAARRTLAGALGVAPAMVALRSGATARLKTFTIQGDPAALGARLAALTGYDAP